MTMGDDEDELSDEAVLADLDQYLTHDSKLLDSIIEQVKILLKDNDETVAWSMCGIRLNKNLSEMSSKSTIIILSSLLSTAAIRLAQVTTSSTHKE